MFHVANDKPSSLLISLGKYKKQQWNKPNFCYTKNNPVVLLIISNSAGHLTPIVVNSLSTVLAHTHAFHIFAWRIFYWKPCIFQTNACSPTMQHATLQKVDKCFKTFFISRTKVPCYVCSWPLIKYMHIPTLQKTIRQSPFNSWVVSLICIQCYKWRIQDLGI